MPRFHVTSRASLPARSQSLTGDHLVTILVRELAILRSTPQPHKSKTRCARLGSSDISLGTLGSIGGSASAPKVLGVPFGFGRFHMISVK